MLNICRQNIQNLHCSLFSHEFDFFDNTWMAGVWCSRCLDSLRLHRVHVLHAVIIFSKGERTIVWEAALLWWGCLKCVFVLSLVYHCQHHTDEQIHSLSLSDPQSLCGVSLKLHSATLCPLSTTGHYCHSASSRHVSMKQKLILLSQKLSSHFKL